jgi:hypothetical protein
MPLTFQGSLPVASINVGLVASLAGLNAELAKLQAEVTALVPAFVAQAQVTVNFPPNPATFAAALTGWLNPVQVAASFASMLVVGADANLDLVVQLGTVTAQVELVALLLAPIELGLAVPGIVGWSYAGRAARFGLELERFASPGFGRFAATTQVRGVVIATESFASWQGFAEGFETGASALAEAVSDVLTFLGAKGGGAWNIGTATLIARLRLFLAELQALQASLEAQIQVTLGVNLPDVTALVDAGLAVDVSVVLDNLVNVQVDLTAAIGALQVKIDALLALIAELDAQLAFGGLAVWTYEGAAGDIGSALRDAIASGVPGGSGANATAYGVALAGTPGALETFGNIFLT